VTHWLSLSQPTLTVPSQTWPPWSYSDELPCNKGSHAKEAAGSVSDHCLTFLTYEGKIISRQNLLNPSSRPLEKSRVDLITVAIQGLNDERYVLVITDQYNRCVDAVPLRILWKSDSKDALIERVLFYECQLQPLLVTALMSDYGGYL
jgi:hypothetical protein